MLEKVKKWIASPKVWVEVFATLAMLQVILTYVTEYGLEQHTMKYYSDGIEFSIWLAASLIIQFLEKEKK